MTSIDPNSEKQYNNRQAVPDFADYLNDWETRSSSYRNQTQGLLNLSYGDTARQVLDIFPVDTTNSGVHIFIHGGYWQALNKDSFSFMAESFNRKGESAVILNYDLCPQVSLDVIIHEIRQAIAWLYKNAEELCLNTETVQITGHSAGGHLVGEMLCTDWEKFGLHSTPFYKATSLSGLFDLVPLIRTSVNTALGLDAVSAEKLSPVHKRPTNTSPVEFLLMVGTLESESYHWQSTEIAKAWDESPLLMHLENAHGCHHFSILDYFLTYYQQSA